VVTNLDAPSSSVGRTNGGDGQEQECSITLYRYIRKKEKEKEKVYPI
jgi:hypothetical protein